MYFETVSAVEVFLAISFQWRSFLYCVFYLGLICLWQRFKEIDIAFSVASQYYFFLFCYQLFAFYFLRWQLQDHVCPSGSDGKESACNAGDLGLIPGSGSSPGEGNGNPLQYSCLENSMDRGAWELQSIGSKELDTNEWLILWLFSCCGARGLGYRLLGRSCCTQA